MRQDMHKVIVERPRRGRGPYRPPAWEKNARLEDLPTKEGIRKRHVRDSKALNENLAPLLRYLEKQVGRPWNAVYRDISAGLRPSSAIKKHVRDHVWDYVERYATLGPNGQVVAQRQRGYVYTLRPGALYVHPRTGLLAKVKRRPKSASSRRRR
jgi:hypothetical protein